MELSWCEPGESALGRQFQNVGAITEKALLQSVPSEQGPMLTSFNVSNVYCLSFCT